tara:strand:+ start:97 stop:633 length:537 start_codon:yes stop_codon:yes gene_type:complete
MMEEQQNEMPESLEYLSEHIIINNPLEQYYYPLKLKQDDLLSQFLMFKNDILIQQQQRQQQQQSNAKVKSTSKSKSNKTPSPPRNKNNLDVASRLIEKQKIKEAKLEKLRQEMEYERGVAASYSGIAKTYYDQGKLNEALEYYNKSLDIYLNEVGKDLTYVALLYNNIGSVYKNPTDK